MMQAITEVAGINTEEKAFYSLSVDCAIGLSEVTLPNLKTR